MNVPLSHPKSLLVLLPLLVAATVQAEEVFQLGTVTVVGNALTGSHGDESTISAKQLEAFNRDTLGSAVALVPGMSVSHNTRNEDIISLRGFDVRQVPLFIDGVPTYVPYDGYVDFGRFTTFDLSEVRVAKGAASLLYGPNTLGGAINLVTRKPTKPFEGDVRLGMGSGSEKRAAANLGGNGGMFYYQVSASYLDADTFPLSKDFKPVATENGGNRENAYRTDKKLSLKVGLTPNATDEYAIGYVKQEGQKGNPPYAGTVPGSGIRYWQWPYWDVESAYALARVALGKNFALKARIYDDKYRNSILAFTDGSYSKQLNNTSFPSWYDDGSRGASLELASYILDNHDLRLAYHYKEDRHKESNPNILPKDFRDVTTSLALEDAIKLGSRWQLRLGAGHDERDTRQADTYKLGDTAKNNWLGELTYQLADNTALYTSATRKSRFPTIKDRYSFRLGTALYNPDLRPETATNLEIGVKAKPWQGGTVQAAVFHSRIEDLMQSVVVPAAKQCPSGPTPNVTCSQLQNIGNARHDGLELSLTQQSGAWSGGVNYTYLQRLNLSSGSIPLTDTPHHKLFAYARWQPTDAWEAQVTLDAEDGRTVAYGSGYTRLGGFQLLGLKGIWKATKDVSLEAGVNNLLDQNYELQDGYPMPGRLWFANVKYRF